GPLLVLVFPLGCAIFGRLQAASVNLARAAAFPPTVQGRANGEGFMLEVEKALVTTFLSQLMAWTTSTGCHFAPSLSASTTSAAGALGRRLARTRHTHFQLRAGRT